MPYPPGTWEKSASRPPSLRAGVKAKYTASFPGALRTSITGSGPVGRMVIWEIQSGLGQPESPLVTVTSHRVSGAKGKEKKAWKAVWAAWFRAWAAGSAATRSA